MNKRVLNKFLRKFGFEVHGLGYLQMLEKSAGSIDAFLRQKEILGQRVKTIFDVGANRGDTILKYHDLYPEATIYAFEPFPDSLEKLLENTKEITSLHVNEQAVSDSNRKSEFYINHNVDTNSLLKSKKIGLNSDKQVSTRGKVEVDVITLDSFCLKNEISEIDILKMDIQGGELLALQGASTLLQQKKIKLIYTEAYIQQQYLDQPVLHDISKFLNKFDYHLQDIYDPIYGNGSLAWCDAIFLPK